MTAMDAHRALIAATGARLWFCIGEAVRRLPAAERGAFQSLPAGSLEGLALLLSSWALRADVGDEVFGELLPHLYPLWRALDALRAVVSPAVQACTARNGMKIGPSAAAAALRQVSPALLPVVLSAENVQLAMAQLLAKFGIGSAQS